MIRYIILAQTDTTANALESFLNLVDGHLSDPDECQRIIWPDGHDLSCFRRIAERMASLARGDNGFISLNQVKVLVDRINLSNLNPIKKEHGWNNIIAMLILAFPEFRWVAGVCTGWQNGGRLKYLAARCSLASLLWSGSDPLFDGDGLRDHVRRCAKISYIPYRTKLAVAIDDELTYAYYHAYIAYRFGFRGHAVTSESLTRELLGNDDVRIKKRLQDRELGLSLEDLFLNFADRSIDASLSDLEKRNKELRQLKDDANPESLRVFVTTGQKKRADKRKWELNQKILENLKRNKRLGSLLFKPVAGIFSLWEESRLINKIRNRKKNGRNGFAKGFIWPPDSADDKAGATSGHDHSAPGKLLEISSRLIERAEALCSKAGDVKEAVQGATLATEALELLGNRTPTTALEALALKHQLEVLSGCLFYGTQFNLMVKPRLEELRLEIRHIGGWFNTRRRTESMNNAELKILIQLAQIFRDHSQFSEEQLCLSRVRRLHRGIWYRKHFWFTPFRPLHAYIDFLMGALPRLFLMIALSILLLSVGFLLDNRVEDNNLTQSFLAGFSSFFGQTDIPFKNFSDSYGLILSRIGVALGFMHLGIFISHLYTIFSRRA